MPSPEIPSTEYDKERWMRALEVMATALGKEGPPVKLCLIGSAACLFAGMELRTTEDLDIWQPSSDFDLLELKRAAEEAGLTFNPTDLLEPGRAYLQIVEPGIVQVGPFEPVVMFRMGRIIVTRPPAENIIASKLVRADAKDIEDIHFLHQHYQADLALVKAIVSGYPAAKRESAEENLVYLEILQ